MKSGWKTSTLGEVLAVLRNGVNCKQDKSGKGDRISRIESISDASFDLEKVGYAELRERDKEHFLLQSGDILFSHINSAVHVGKTALFDSSEPVYHGVNLLLMRPTEEVTSEYLNHALKYLFQSGYWRGVCKQSVNQASVNQQDISKVEIRFPKSVAEQQRIVGVLDEAFAGLATAQANAAKNLQNARALFASHLQSVFTHCGKGWVETKLGDVAEFKNGLNFTRQSKGQTLQIVGVGDFQDNAVVPIDTLQSVTINGKLSDDYLIRRDDILTVRSNGSKDLVGRCMIVPEVDGMTSYSGFIIRIRFDTREICPRFLLRFMKSSETRKRLTRDGGGANISNINQAKLSDLPISLPLFREQENLADELDALATETQRLESLYQQKQAALAALKKSLLHQAFTGAL